MDRTTQESRRARIGMQVRILDDPAAGYLAGKYARIDGLARDGRVSVRTSEYHDPTLFSVDWLQAVEDHMICWMPRNSTLRDMGLTADEWFMQYKLKATIVGISTRAGLNHEPVHHVYSQADVDTWYTSFDTEGPGMTVRSRRFYPVVAA